MEYPLLALPKPEATAAYAQRSDNISRFLGFEIPNIPEARECAFNRATLVGYGQLTPGRACKYRVPLPNCLQNFTEPRSFAITLAWFSPIIPKLKQYRGARLMVRPDDPSRSIGVDRSTSVQPDANSAARGTVIHNRFSGNQAVPFLDGGNISATVWCKKETVAATRPVRYGIAISIESESAIPIYEEVRDRMRLTAQVA